MATEITNISRLTFGVNFLGKNGGEEVDKLWKSRFAEREAFLVTADPQTNPREIFEQFRTMLVQQNQLHLVGKECLLTFFVDYTADLPKEAEAAVWGMRKVMETVLGCSVQAVIQFAYVGRRGDESAKQRSNVKRALENNQKKQVYENYRLCLVGKSVLQDGEDHNWKAAVVFVDLLRRCEAVSNYLPMAGDLGRSDICFLRYGEYDEVVYSNLKKRYEDLRLMLADADGARLRDLVDQKRNDMISQIESRYVINGAEHPQHPDMIVPDVRSMNPFATNTRAAAKRGKNPAYTNAQKHTREAVEATGQRMRMEIGAWFQEHVDAADQTLEEFFREANVGIKLKMKPVDMYSALYIQPYAAPGTIPSLTLPYSEQGVENEIGNYLESIKKDAISIGLAEYAQALRAAFDKIPQDDFVNLRKSLERERDEAGKTLEKTLDAKGFCDLVAQSYPPESIFDITNEMVVENQKFLLCRDSVVSIAEKSASLGMISVHSVDEPMCGMVKFDNAPLKALMIESVDCRDWVLDQLLPEVDYDFDF